VVGAGSSGPTISDYALGSLDGNGSANNTFGYGAVTFGVPTSDGVSVSQLTITRNMVNNYSGSITVNETGLYCRAYDGTAARYFMLIHDVIAGGIAVPAGQTLTLNYRPQAAV
jgi:hypothetical protein